MKKAIYFVMFATLTMLAACEKKDDNNQVAQTPVLTCNLPGQTNCNPGVYQQAGWQVTAYQYSYSNGFCGCPVGSRPVISPQYGIGCAPAGAFQQQYQYGGYFGSPSNGQWTNTPQISFNPAISGTNNCYADAAKSCSVRGANTCASGQTCRPVGGASDLGLCTSGYGQENYEHPRNCGYTRDGYGRWQYICSSAYNNSGYGYGSGYGGGYGGQIPR